MKKIVIVGLPEDYHASAVRWGLKQLGVDSEVWMPSDLPDKTSVSIEFSEDFERVDAQHQGNNISMLDAGLIWVRRIGYPSAPSWAHQHDVPVINTQCWEHVQNALTILSTNVRCINDFLTSKFADRKAFQILQARKCGFCVPRTLFSNNFDEIRQFVESCDGAISKPYHVYQWVQENTGYSDLTAVIEEVLQEHKRSIELAPRVYQEQVDKLRDVRVIRFGRYSFGLSTELSPDGIVDCRYEAQRNPDSQNPIDVPHEILTKIDAYLDAVGIDYGAFDFCIDRNENWQFLECNEAGQFLFLERIAPEMNVLETFCRWLAEEAGIKVIESAAAKIGLVEFDQDPKKSMYTDYQSHKAYKTDHGLIFE